MVALLKKMGLATPDEVPFLFPNINSLVSLLNKCDVWMIDHFLKFMIVKDSRGILYN